MPFTQWSPYPSNQPMVPGNCLATPMGAMMPNLGGPVPGLCSVEGISDFSIYCNTGGVTEKTIKACLSGEFCTLDNVLENLTLSPENMEKLQAVVDQYGNIVHKRQSIHLYLGE